MKNLLVLSVLFFVLAGTTCFGQDIYLDLNDTPKKVSQKTIMAVVEKARVENNIKNINVIKKGQVITFRYPDGVSFSHIVAEGECMIGVVTNYLTIPNYAEYVAPRKKYPVYWKKNK